MFVEVMGPRPLPDDVDRDDVEDLLVVALGKDGEVTGAGSGSGRWHLDVEVSTGVEELQTVLRRLAAVLVDHDLGWIVLRPEQDPVGVTASRIQ
ncbi:hypothetical protein BJY16_007239 [Actinoplanes octamycinicus]|uniref:Uncharacterized protein n=1 Tax=Actinoplanes octamycinicus TaxID=135948 RepID=A0A7W7H4C8_9ACTN|nr:hypothetical protein [Actinoplanes octamycinicus]MBB4743780.1 hypothetical protein [Actinoplanes octamycinicus]